MKLKQNPKQYHVLRNTNQLILNYKKSSYFPLFTHDAITQSTSHRNIMYLYRGHSSSTSLGKGDGIDKESNEK